jgi:hypothetical protein
VDPRDIWQPTLAEVSNQLLKAEVSSQLFNVTAGSQNQLNETISHSPSEDQQELPTTESPPSLSKDLSTQDADFNDLETIPQHRELYTQPRDFEEGSNITLASSTTSSTLSPHTYGDSLSLSPPITPPSTQRPLIYCSFPNCKRTFTYNHEYK